MDAKDWTLCAVCGYPLMHDPKRVFGGPEWTHSGFRPGEDHVPVPVPASEMTYYNGRCDFCDGEEVTTIILAEDFDLPVILSHSTGPWGACAACGELASARRWGKLATRVQRTAPTGVNTPHDVLMMIYTELHRHMTGAIPLEEWRQRGNYPVKGNS